MCREYMYVPYKKKKEEKELKKIMSLEYDETWAHILRDFIKHLLLIISVLRN